MTQRAEDRGKIADFGLRIADCGFKKEQAGDRRN
jgi:hypothetical protein